jgi:hypothetical protein
MDFDVAERRALTSDKQQSASEKENLYLSEEW